MAVVEASVDCSAKVREANPEAKTAHAILVESSESYLLTPCKSRNWFVVELCDSVLVDTLVLANFEPFSSVFASFEVHVRGSNPPETWHPIGNFTSQRTREAQVFPVGDQHVWARFIRVEFTGYHGSDFYCPVSLFRVHGITMIQQYQLEKHAPTPTPTAAATATQGSGGSQQDELVVPPVSSESTDLVTQEQAGRRFRFSAEEEGEFEGEEQPLDPAEALPVPPTGQDSNVFTEIVGRLTALERGTARRKRFLEEQLELARGAILELEESVSKGQRSSRQKTRELEGAVAKMVRGLCFFIIIYFLFYFCC